MEKENPNLGCYQPQHLYFLSDEKIKEGDWCLYQHNETIVLKKNNVDKYGHIQYNNIGYDLQYCKKVIATTDESLLIESWYESIDLGMQPTYKNLPQPSQSFIQKYVDECLANVLIQNNPTAGLEAIELLMNHFGITKIKLK